MNYSKIYKCLIVIVAVFVLVSLIGGILIAYFPTKMSKEHTEEVAKMFIEDMNFDLDDFYKVYGNKIESFSIKSKYGHSIPVKYMCDDGYDKTIVLVHWHETNYKTMLPIAEMFIKQGYNVVMYDQRSHGDNNAKTVSFGYYEKDDLTQVIDFINEKLSNTKTIGILGQSMGASTVGYYCGTKHATDNISFAIMDSPFSSMDSEIMWNIKSLLKLDLPSVYFKTLGSIASNIIYGYSFSDVDIKTSLKRSNIPTMIMHSRIDKVCPFYMGEELYSSLPDKLSKRFVEFKKSNHIQAFFTESEMYNEQIFNFIQETVNQ